MIAAAIFAVALLSGLRIGTNAAAAAAPAKAGASALNSDLYIYDPTGAQLLGRAHYTVTQHDGMVTIEGRNEFIDPSAAA